MHHTKEKGDLGVAKCHARLAELGFKLLYPMSEHLPFDLVAYQDGLFYRVQVKYRCRDKLGQISANLANSWADKNGNHRRKMNKGEVDLVCIYCPETDKCYFLSKAQLGDRESVILRLTPSKNSQALGIRYAKDYEDIPRVPDEGKAVQLREQPISADKPSGATPEPSTFSEMRI